MDARETWKISSKVDSLVEAIVACRKQLINHVKTRNPYNRNTKIRYCDVHASPKVCQLLSVSQMWRDYSETKDDFEIRRHDKRPHSQKMVADFELFKVVEDNVVGDDDVRIAMEFEVNKEEWESCYGNVALVTR